MLKFAENAYTVVLEKEREKKLELEKAKQINEELKLKLKKLEEENGNLKNKFTKNEIDVITKKNELNTLLQTLQEKRRSALEESQRLQICKEQIDSIVSYIEELRPIKEQLNFKNNVTECLHDLLIKTKLRIAESEDVLQELHDYKNQLEYDIEKTKDVHRRGVADWQDEFLAARLREADVILEFDKIKREIAIIKSELEEKILIRDAQETVQNQSGKIATTKNSSEKTDKICEALIEEERIVIAHTVQLQNELDFLRHQLKKLEDHQEDCIKRIKSNEEIKLQLNEVRRSMWLREFEINRKTEDLKESYKKLAEKMSQELAKIQKNMEGKDMDIAKIEEEIKHLEKRNASLELDFKSDQHDNNDASKLEERKYELEQEIIKLKKT